MADKKAFQSAPAAVEVGPRLRPVLPPPYPESAPVPPEIHYPYADRDKPLADDAWQMSTMLAQYAMLGVRYDSAPNTLVAMALLLYYTEGEPADVVAPDVFVAFGVPERNRYWYKVWEEGKAPDSFSR